MPDTGAPWNIPYVDPTDLVRDYPQASEDLADAIADGLDAAGGLVAIKTAIRDEPFTVSLGSSGSADIDDLTISHEVADAANRIILIGYAGKVTAPDANGPGGIGFAKGGVLLNPPGGTPGIRTLMGSSGFIGAAATTGMALPLVAFDTPGTGSKTYTMRVISGRDGTFNVRVNSTSGDANNHEQSRTVSIMVLMEVKV